MSTINHPSHYNLPNRKECIVEMEEQFGLECTITFCLMNAYKYLYRAGNKADNTTEQDISKATWYYEWVHDNYRHLKEMRNSENIIELYLTIGGMLDGE